MLTAALDAFTHWGGQIGSWRIGHFSAQIDQRLLQLGVAEFVAIILRIVPHVRLAMQEVLIAATVGAVLWEAARHLFSWLVGPDSPYIQAFGQLGGIMALFAWVYLSSVILVLTGQFAWAYAMESRGEGQFATQRHGKPGPMVESGP